MCLLTLLFYCISSAISKNRMIPWAPWYLQGSEVEYEMVSQDDFPDFPTPIAITDKTGGTKWTFWVPPSHDFPQHVRYYSDVAAKCHEVADLVRQVAHDKLGHQRTLPFFRPKNDDPNFVDVSEALDLGMLPRLTPAPEKVSGVRRSSGPVGVFMGNGKSQPACKKTMTFVLESAHAGIGSAIMLLWIAYGVAQSQGRAFFIDDSRWAYGRYTEIFQPPPIPDCRPPPIQEMIPCPHNARHLVVTSSTAKETLEAAFNKEYDDAHRMEMYRQRQMFNLARKGYHALFKLSDDDAEYVERRVAELDNMTLVGESSASDGVLVGVHVRRGDCHPIEYQYHDSYIPLNYYRDKVKHVLENRLNNSARLGGPKAETRNHSYVLLASDDPNVYNSEEFKESLKAQQYIALATKSALENARYRVKAGGKRKWIEEEFGWEGGFFAPMFWNLGVNSANAKFSSAPDAAEVVSVSPETMRTRNYLGRAYMMDLAVLSRRSDAVVCAVSAMGCRLIAVMMGWDSAISRGNWVNIDGEYGWTGLTW